MKKSLKQLLSFLLVIGMVSSVSSCNNDDDEPVIDPPTVTAGSSQAVQVGLSATVSFTLTVPGKIASVSATSTVGSVEVTNSAELVGETSGTASVSFTAPSTPGTAVITLSVTDDLGKSDDAFATVDITAEPQATIVDVYASGDGLNEGATTINWTADNIYVLRGFIFVNEGQTLNIEAGTVIKGQPGQGAGASALIVARGGKINATGTAENPIIFTGLADDLEGSIANDATATWGGVIILGNASTNDNDGLRNIEGIPTEDSRGLYGNTTPVDDDNSGTMTYVSIRHGGSLIGSDNEINGLSLGAVGSATTLENIEVFSNLDDGVEFFGGTAHIKGLVIAFPGDDGIDIDEGFSGRIEQGLVWRNTSSLQSSDPREEWDGGDGTNEGEMPYGFSVLSNITFVYDDTDAENKNMAAALLWRDNNSTSIYNSIVYGYDNRIDMERRTDKQSSYDRFMAGELVVAGNNFFNINGSESTFASMFEISDDADATLEAAVETSIVAINTFVNPTFGTGVDKFKPSGSGMTPTTDLPTGVTARAYVGGIDPSGATPFFANWTKTWAVLSAN